MAGLTAARTLAASAEVVVVDKGRGVGGRLATRRIGDATLDHGAQFLTARSADFAAAVAAWERAGVATPWFSGPSGQTRLRGTVSMNAIAKHLAAGLDVRTSALVTALTPSDGGWTVGFDDGTTLDADAVVLTAPVPQALALLAAGGAELADADAGALDAIAYDPCTAVLAVLDGPSGIAPPGAVEPQGGPIAWLADNHGKGISARPAVTIHATPAFTVERWDEPDDVVAAELLAAADLRAAPIADGIQVHRWRYARPTVLHPEPCLVAAGLPPLVLAGDAFGGPKVEGAAISGWAAARAIADLLGRER